LLSLLRKAKQARASSARIVLALMLMFVLLSSVAPFSSLAARGCKMACCVGKAQGMASSCSFTFASERQAQISDEQGKEHSAHSHAQHVSPHGASSSEESSQTASLAAQAMTSPCSLECCTGALSSVQGRRQRNHAIIADAAKPRPSTLLVFSRQSINPARFLSHLRDQSVTRGPPLFT
jgi:hypothetical protein